MSTFAYNSILVPIDYSDSSLRAAQIARTLTDDEKITLVHVTLHIDLYVPSHNWVSDILPESHGERVQRLRTWRDENNLGNVNVRIEGGDPGMEVCRVAAELDAPLIVVPSHGRHGLKRIVLGSVAERIIRHCDCSVLVLRRNADQSEPSGGEETEFFPRRKVIVPIDFSESSQLAIDAGILAAGSPSDVYVLNVVYELDSPLLIGSEVMTDDSRRAGRQANLDRWLKEQGYGSVNAHVATGDPGITIVDYATRIEADLIVMPSHGYHGLNRLVLGSTTERVLRYAASPILVLRRHDAE